MNQHCIQEAYYKSFRDKGEIWVYPNVGGQAFRKPISWCTAETDFQSKELEKMQTDIIEDHGIRAIWHLLKPGRLSEQQYKILLGWIALHLTRAPKVPPNTLFQTNQHYEREFPVEFTRQLLGLRSSYTVADVYTCYSPKFLITCDNPVPGIRHRTRRQEHSDFTNLAVKIGPAFRQMAVIGSMRNVLWTNS